MHLKMTGTIWFSKIAQGHDFTPRLDLFFVWLRSPIDHVVYVISLDLYLYINNPLCLQYVSVIEVGDGNLQLFWHAGAVSHS